MFCDLLVWILCLLFLEQGWKVSFRKYIKGVFCWVLLFEEVGMDVQYVKILNVNYNSNESQYEGKERFDCKEI